MFVVDTNILVYAADKDSMASEKCFESLEIWRQRADAWYITWSICLEFMSVVTNRRVLRAPWNVGVAWRFIEGLLAAPALRILVPTAHYPMVLRELAAQSLSSQDETCMTPALPRLCGIMVSVRSTHMTSASAASRSWK